MVWCWAWWFLSWLTWFLRWASWFPYWASWFPCWLTWLLVVSVLGLRGFRAGSRGFCAGLHTYRAGLRDFHAGLRGFCAGVVCRCGFFAVLQKLNSEGRQKLSTKHEQTKMKFELFGVWVAQGLFWSFWWAGLRGFWLGNTRLQCFAAFSSRGGHETAKPNRNQVG